MTSVSLIQAPSAARAAARASSSAPRSRPVPAAGIAGRLPGLSSSGMSRNRRGAQVRPLKTAFDPSYLENYAQDQSAKFMERESDILETQEEKWAEMQKIAGRVVAAAETRDEAELEAIVEEADEVWEYLQSSTDFSDTSSYLFFKTVSASLDNWVAPEFYNLNGRTAQIAQKMLDGLREVGWPLLKPRKPEDVALARHAAGVTFLVIDAVREAGDGGDPDFGPVQAALAGGTSGEEGSAGSNFCAAVSGLLEDGKLTPESRFLDGVYQEALDGIVSYMQLEGFELSDSDDIAFV